ncbi:MAG: arabinan endo-1,5-alpha-L-arabinosidase [Myxococcales bacterium]|jgi:arabinan endo-1,5-alpha-L-arabinosidase
MPISPRRTAARARGAARTALLMAAGLACGCTDDGPDGGGGAVSRAGDVAAPSLSPGEFTDAAAEPAAPPGTTAPAEVAAPGNDGAPGDAGATDGPGTDASGPSDAGGPLGSADSGAGLDDGQVSCAATMGDGAAPAPLSLSGNTFAHDPTMIEVDGVVHRFWTGDFIPSATSTDLRHWRSAPTVYGGDYPGWVDDWLDGVPGETFNFPWAPDVSRFGGRVHIYSSFSARFGDNVSCITHLTTEDPAQGQWTDHGPVLCTEGDEPYNAIDADVALDANGTPFMAFGSFWDGILAVELDQGGDPVGGEPVRLAWAPQVEAPVLLRHCGRYYLFVTWGLCCPGEGRSVADLTYRVAVGRSDHILGPYLDREGVPMLEGGGTLVVEGDGEQFAAAGHSDVLAFDGGLYHVYHAYRLPSGAAELRITPLRFDAEGWPVPTAP